MSEAVSIAVIGAGYWGAKLVEEYLALSNKRSDVKLRSVVDNSSETLMQIGKRFSLPKSTLKKDYNEILGDDCVTGVHIATPNETHYEVATKAVKAGKHVLLEKPMCLSSVEALKLARNAEKNNTVLLIGHIFRFNNAVNKVKELVEKREIDGVRCVELRWTSLMPPPPGRDIIFDLAPHPIDILNHVFEEWPTQVFVKAGSYERRKAGLEEVAFATLTFPQDIIALATLSWMHHGPKHRTFTLINETSTVETETVKQTIKVYRKGRTIEIPVRQNNTIESEISHFVGRIKNNDPPVNSALTGVVNVTVLEAMTRSLRENRVTSIIGR